MVKIIPAPGNDRRRDRTLINGRVAMPLNGAKSRPLSRKQRPTAWKRRLQKVSMRTKIVVPMVLLAVVPSMSIGIFTISRMRESLYRSAVQLVEFETSSRAQAVQEFLRSVQQDLLFLSQSETIRALVRGGTSPDSRQLPGLRQRAAEELLVFSQGKRAYFQVRCLDGSGRELVRLNVAGGRPTVVAVQQLQDKSQRYYFKEAIALDPGEIYVSPMDFNIEFGEVESPPRTVVRYATPVSGDDGEQGVVIINIYSGFLFSLAGRLSPAAEAWWVDERGGYLGYVGKSEERRRRFDLSRDLSADYTTAEMAAILRGGRQPIETPDSLVFFAPIEYDDKDSSMRWTLMISHPRAPIDAPIRQFTILFSFGVALIVVLAGVLGVFVAHYLARPVDILRQATREIAAGNLSNSVEITTGDEIEDLAVGFNAMTAKLREAQEQLSAWNNELEQKVERQTRQLRGLQSGLARADKLASIGQMTAGVMHEVGNPLAAIKTKIQVAGEEGDICQKCQQVFGEVLTEVNRLTTFLRSFSRLARLREPRMEPVRTAEVIESVVTLVAPDLQRKGISLRVEVDHRVPSMLGDSHQLRQLIINLILNAAEASPQRGEVLVRVTGSTAGDGRETQIEIIDHGTGVPSEVLPRIWEPFFTTKTDGTGLGLAICRQIVQDHNGTIRIRSTSGEGTVVSLAFPGRVSAANTPSRRERL